MKKIKILIKLIVIVIAFTACSSSKKVEIITDNNPLAFPGAEGYGKFTTGGRGGKIFIVTNLNDNGPGSFREAAEANLPRTILFAVDGIIHLNATINIKSNATVAGHSAPGDGICFADKTVNLAGDNIIVRYLRFRMGDKLQRLGGMVDGNGGDDAFGGIRRKNIMIDHCSFSWSNDETCTVYAGDSTTIQWCIMSEPLNYSYHFETGDKDYEHHGFGGIWGGLHFTGHHNLFAHCLSRNPRFNGIRHTPTEVVDFYNNVIYNWGDNSIYAGEGGAYNIVNNYLKAGPSTKKNVLNRIANPWRNEKIKFGQWYVNGNYIHNQQATTNNNALGVALNDKATAADKAITLVANMLPNFITGLQTTEAAYKTILASAGASYKRDTLDLRIMENVKNGTGSIIDVQGGFVHGTPFEQTINAWPALKQGQLLTDTDKDGMPDAYEIKQGLNSKDATDAVKILSNGYTNLEVYLNNLLQ